MKSRTIPSTYLDVDNAFIRVHCSVMETPLFSNLFFTTLREASASPHRIWLNHMDYLVQMEMDAFPVYIIVLLHKGEWIKM